ncbi:MAG: metallophosphoesterase [Synergistaceae bacterium]|jgi:predicted MPP superfamily phosphohydrolase|nr:metallophosphoesterase [Synergistaceae bacterium]
MSISVLIITVLGLYIGVNAYMFIRLWMTLEGAGLIRGISCAIFLFLALSFPLGRTLHGHLPAQIPSAFGFIGALYLSPMIYGFILTVSADILRLLNCVVKITPNPPPFTVSGRTSVVATVAALSVLITFAGALNAKFPIIVRHEADWSGSSGALETQRQIRIAVVSDIHLGGMVGTKHLGKIVGLTNSASPDIILLAGDVLDDEKLLNDPKMRSEAASLLSSLSSRLGSWAVPGNHDYYVGIERFMDFMGETNVKVLRDEFSTPGGEAILLGRDDRSASVDGKQRAGIEEILLKASSGGVNTRELPLIVMDHQPFGLDESQNAGAALQVSGHTHRGQIFPFNYLVSLMYEKHYGLYKKGDTNYYISSGAGTWGPPIRTTGRPEIAIITLNVK